MASAWAKHRQSTSGFADPEHPFRLQGSADLNSYKMFAEVFWNLLRPDGRLGVILPTGIYSDFGTKDLRETLLFQGRIEFLYAFQNEKKVFSAADHRFKQVALFATKGGSTRVVPHPVPHGRGRLAGSPRNSRRHPPQRLGGDGLHARRRADEQPEDVEPRRTQERA